MDVNQIVTKQDLFQVKAELLSALKETLSQVNNSRKQWLKSTEVQEMLGLSASGLQNLRISGAVPYSKLSGIIYYNYNDIVSILTKNKKGTI